MSKYNMHTVIESYATGTHVVQGRGAYEIQFHFTQHAVDLGVRLDTVTPQAGVLRFTCPSATGGINQGYTLQIPPGKVSVIVVLCHIN